MEMIFAQLRYFSVSLVYGAGLMFLYDFILVFRSFVRHTKLWIVLGDWFFWLAAAVFVFRMVFALNYGMIRSFFVISFIIGMALYRKLVGQHFVHLLCTLLKWIFRPYVWIAEKFDKKMAKRKNKS
jgi:hypothetical protein